MPGRSQNVRCSSFLTSVANPGRPAGSLEEHSQSVVQGLGRSKRIFCHVTPHLGTILLGCGSRWTTGGEPQVDGSIFLFFTNRVHGLDESEVSLCSNDPILVFMSRTPPDDRARDMARSAEDSMEQMRSGLLDFLSRIQGSFLGRILEGEESNMKSLRATRRCKRRWIVS